MTRAPTATRKLQHRLAPKEGEHHSRVSNPEVRALVAGRRYKITVYAPLMAENTSGDLSPPTLGSDLDGAPPFVACVLFGFDV